jgi:hypothetical protein
MDKIIQGFEAIYNAPKDWTPGGGLFWLTGLVVGWGAMTCVTAYFEHRARQKAQLPERAQK